MKLLLDTHILLWVAAGDPRLPEAAASLVLDPDAELWFSAASIWEVAIKRALDRPDFQTDPGVLRAGLMSNGYRELAIEGRHCLGLVGLPALHADPFDRLLVTTAQSDGLTLITADRKVAQYPGPIRLV